MGPVILFSSFLNGATLALYQGSPLERSFGKFVQVALQFLVFPVCKLLLPISRRADLIFQCLRADYTTNHLLFNRVPMSICHGINRRDLKHSIVWSWCRNNTRIIPDYLAWPCGDILNLSCRGFLNDIGYKDGKIVWLS